MASVKLLDTSTINKIAAGEVVERSDRFTRLGKLDNPAGLEKILGAGDVRVKIFGGD